MSKWNRQDSNLGLALSREHKLVSVLPPGATGEVLWGPAEEHGFGDSYEAPLGSVLGHSPMSFVTETVGPEGLKNVRNEREYFSSQP